MNCRLRDFSVSFLVGSTVYAVPLSYVGCLFNSISDLEDSDELSLNSPVGLSLAIVGGVASLLATVAITYYTKKKMDKLLEDVEQAEVEK